MLARLKKWFRLIQKPEPTYCIETEFGTFRGVTEDVLPIWYAHGVPGAKITREED